jgi:MFS family permease
MQWLAKQFPTYGEKNIFLFYLVSIFGHSWFMIANWLFFVLFYISEGEFAWYESIAFAVGILLEIPSGAIADLLGRHKTLILAFGMQMLGALGFVLADVGAGLIFIGNLMIIASFALQSGALEALVYDTLKQSGKDNHYDEVLGKGHSITLLTIMVAGAIGGLLWQFSVYAPWILTCIFFIVAFIISFFFVEPRIDSDVFTLKNFIDKNRKGFYYLFKSDFRKYTFPLAALAGTFIMWETGIIVVLMGRDFGYNGTTLSFLMSAVLFVSFLVSFNFRTIRKRLGDHIGYIILLICAMTGWLLASIFTNSIIIGALVFVLLSASGSISELWNSVILNQHVASKDRATAISTLSFFIQIPYVLVVVLFGTLSEAGRTNEFYLATSAVLLVALVAFWRAEKSDIIVKS